MTAVPNLRAWLVSYILDNIPLNVGQLVISDMKFFKNHGSMNRSFPYLIIELCRRAGVGEYSRNTLMCPRTPIHPLKIYGEGIPAKSKKWKIDLGKSTCEDPKYCRSSTTGPLEDLGFWYYPRGRESPPPPAIHMCPALIMRGTWKTRRSRHTGYKNERCGFELKKIKKEKRSTAGRPEVEICLSYRDRSLRAVITSGQVRTMPRVGDWVRLILEEAHWSRYFIHLGVTKMYHDLRQHYRWGGVRKDVADFVACCQSVKVKYLRPSGLLQSYEINVGQFLAREMKDRAVRGEKSLLEYSCMITQLCLAAGVRELLGIDDMIEAMNTTDLGMTRDATNSLAKQAKQGFNILTEIYRS
ncbi:putative pentatricopeptide repeat-containing protein-like [Capsicum annuum]|nr:putative pentatricopeptide repeat-containing protein-like [Capsicum annuum]